MTTQNGPEWSPPHLQGIVQAEAQAESPSRYLKRTAKAFHVVV
jgi:hypothetical protein|eukprot:COSAG06_NODE_60_length_27159_cov_57.986031_6_plen_43_part_00